MSTHRGYASVGLSTGVRDTSVMVRWRMGSTVVAAALALGAIGCTGDATGGNPGTAARAGTAGSEAPPGTTVSIDPERAAEIDQLIRTSMDENSLRAVLVKVSVDGEEVITKAYGESMTGVPATTDMRFRNGAVAISYVATLLLQLVDEGKVSLDDKVSTYLPDMASGDQVTVGQLARMTSGYRDYERNEQFQVGFYQDPFATWTTEQKIELGADLPLWFEPGTNWSYAHTNYVVLGLVLEEITGQSMHELMQERVLDPLGLDGTVGDDLAPIPEPALHAFTSERREVLGIPAGTAFTEESSYWNPSWSLNSGAIQTTTIGDMDRSAIAIGTGELLSPESYAAMTSTDLRGFGTASPECAPSCGPQTEYYSYGIGLVTSGDWVLQNPLFGGYAGVMAYLPPERIAISVAVTYLPGAFDETGGYTGGNQADALFRQIGALMAPDDAPPLRPQR